MVKPGGTGRPRLAISARPAPLPPSRLRMPARPSALPLPKRYTHFGLPAAPLTAALAAAALPAVPAGRGGADLRAGADRLRLDRICRNVLAIERYGLPWAPNDHGR